MTAETSRPDIRWADVADTLRHFGVTYRQFDYWARMGYLGDDLIPHGSGIPRDITPMAIRRAAVMGALIEMGFATGDLAALYAHRLAENGDAVMDTAYLTVRFEFNDWGHLPAPTEEDTAP